MYVKFFEGSINSARYMEIVEEFYDEFLNEQDRNEVWFQQDGAPPHRSAVTTAFLNDKFGARCINNATIPVAGRWPPRSPDLTVCDWFINGVIHDRVFKANPVDMNELKTSIQCICDSIPLLTLRDVFLKQHLRLQKCIALLGGHIEV